ncbi:MAG TPA: type II toxin-antitoxin system HicA family toxin [Alphaproteobacteria bacterium]|jgi:predicted RNA binding protein YcfA (HicA-like mRNA interferase family)|nr:type II toxin-antitoxin system HicA family toxin [Alphaproteobacteria bacterium]
MPKLPPVKAKDLIKILNKSGFSEVRQKGSHKFFRHKDGRTTVVPYHQKNEISRGLLRAILEDIKMSVEEYLKLRK